MPKVLFIASHRPHRSPSQRFRFEQYFSFLTQNGFECDLSYLISEKDDRIFYLPGNLHTKFYIFIKSFLKRMGDIKRASHYDIIFIQREAFMTGSVYFEKKFRSSKAKIIFDFDDAIWHLDISDANKRFVWLKDPGKTAKIISTADQILAGNQYLADYAKHHNENVVVIPTTINTDEYVRQPFENRSNELCIGWSGSMTTIKHFEFAIPVLTKIQQRFGKKIGFKIIGDSSFRHPELDIMAIPWNIETEIPDLSAFDIGIMPLPNDEWARGKCGLKALQYMSLEIPTIASPVGVNTEIIRDGVNGFLASSEDEWVEKLSALIESQELRRKLGAAGRQTVIERYSFHSQKEKYLKCFNDLLGKKP